MQFCVKHSEYSKQCAYLPILPVQFLDVVCPDDSLLVRLSHQHGPPLIVTKIQPVCLEWDGDTGGQ